jgi:pimeloyl-ACP methyl ester carboxylesterase
MKTYFFPGLGADRSLEPYHRIPGLEIEWVNWPSKISTNWELFLQNLQRENNIQGGSLFIGISFGGLVATQLAKVKKPSAVILVGSLIDSIAVSTLFRFIKWVVPVIPSFVFNLNWAPRWVISYFFGIQQKPHLVHFYRMVRGYSPHQAKALIQLALSAPPIEIKPAIYSIHGKKDRILPYKKAQPGYQVEEGGHLLSMTHSSEINRAILDWLNKQNLVRARK